MPKYMVVVKDDENRVYALFYPEYYQAENYRQAAECGLGYYAEMYLYSEPEGYVVLS